MSSSQSTGDAVQPTLPSAIALLKPSWTVTRTNLTTFAYLILTPLTFLVTAEGFVGIHTSRGLHTLLIGLGWLLLLASIALWAVTIPAITYVRIQSVRSQRVEYLDAIKKGAKLAYRWWLLQLMLSLIVVGGFILLIVPGFFMVRRYVLSRYILVDKNVTPIEALKESAALSQKYSTAMWSTTFLLSAIVAAYAVLPRGLGVLVWIVMSAWDMCGTALRYEEVLQDGTKKSKPKKKSAAQKKAAAHRRAKKKS